MKKTVKLLAAAAIALTSVSLAQPAGADDFTPSIEPAFLNEVVFPGEFVEIDKTVHTPNLPPVLDVCLVVDLSGSYDDDLPNIMSLAPGIWDAVVAGGVSDLQFGLASFVDFPFPNWGSADTGDYAYRLDQQLTSDKATWLAAVNAMVTYYGGDGPESQYEALYQVATGAGNDVLAAEPDDVGDVAAGQQCNYRENATKVVMLTTDAPFHNAGDSSGPGGVLFSYPGASAADTTDALADAGIAVIGLKAPGSVGELDVLALATGGTTVTTADDSSDIATAILAALEELDIEVSMTSDCAYPITTTFDPASKVVQNGTDAKFAETISVAADAPGGVYTCRDWAVIGVGDEAKPMTDAAGAIIYETKTITVPENFVTGGGHVTNGLKGKNRATILSHGGNAGYMPDGTLVGNWNFQIPAFNLHLQARDITALQFVDTGVDPAPPEADADVAIMTADGRANFGDGWEDCTMTVTFTDHGEPEMDSVEFNSVVCPSGSGAGYLEVTGGNIQIHDGTKG